MGLHRYAGGGVALAGHPVSHSTAPAGAGPVLSPTGCVRLPAYSPSAGSYPVPGREAVLFSRRPDEAEPAGDNEKHCSGESENRVAMYHR